MNGQRNLRRANAWVVFSALVTSTLFISATREVGAFVDNDVPGLVYHAQVTSYYCGSATVQMMLDNTAVRSANPYLNWVLNPANAPDPAPASFYNQFTGQDATFATIPFNALNNIGQSIHPTIAPVAIPGVNGGNPVNAITYGPQLAIYDFAHGAGTYTPVQGPFTGVQLSYFNPFQPWGAGSGINGQQYTLNVFDNPNVGGEGNHVYTAYNVGSLNVANRTIANAINNYQVPAGGVFYSGAHAMAITGVRTDVEPVANQPYKILGFYVDDPWNGYAIARNLPANQRGLRKHQLISNVPRGAFPSRWAQIFNPSPGEPGEGAYAQGIGYKFVVEPQGPEPLDDGVFSGDLPPVPELPTDLNATDALVLAQALLASDTYLNSKYGLSGGGFDGSAMSLLNPSGENDWFIPYKRGSDYTGVFLLSADYGILEQASWDDAGELSSNLGDLLAQYQGIQDGYHPDDNPTNLPEPATHLLMLAIVLAFGRGRRRV